MDDTTSLILVFGAVIKEKLSTKNKLYNLNVFLMLISSQIVILALASYLSRGFLYIYLDAR
ncbi:hypothetical protein S101520_01743 [Lactiplantibacillus plantarum subsp. plantarum]|nr:hypothetical protein S101520_01743 [Lactiplantibacillus plantarum subsp. plantarum]